MTAKVINAASAFVLYVYKKSDERFVLENMLWHSHPSHYREGVLGKQATSLDDAWRWGAKAICVQITKHNVIGNIMPVS